MKTAVSLPDPVFHAAESLAHRLGMSRSQLFREALEAYIASHDDEHIREALDNVYSKSLQVWIVPGWLSFSGRRCHLQPGLDQNSEDL